ncbi:g520 [Coccomyxa viridis]|uniref:G520 protein n=1 Tax=Coccomyxa viridis TaxID=1274662 RepID=A0ABP1FL83_9CHLO
MYGALGKNKKGEDEEWQIDHVVEIQMFTQYLGISVFDGTDVSAGFMYDLYIVINSANNLCRISPGLNAFKKTMTTRAIKMMEPQGHRNSWEFIDWRTGYNIEIMLHLQLSDIQKQLTALTPASKAEGQKGEKEQQDPKIVKLSQQHEKVVQDLRMVIHLIAYMENRQTLLLHLADDLAKIRPGTHDLDNRWAVVSERIKTWVTAPPRAGSAPHAPATQSMGSATAASSSSSTGAYGGF